MRKRITHNITMNKLDSAKRTRVISCLVEGCSILSTVRMTGVSKKTVMRLLVEIGAVCSRYQDAAFRNLTCRRLQVDEMWAFVGAKQKNLTPENIALGAVGDVWLWIAIDAESKLVPSWLLGDRGADTARDCIADMAGRLKSRIHITSDGHRVYRDAVEHALGAAIDY